MSTLTSVVTCGADVLGPVIEAGASARRRGVSRSSNPHVVTGAVLSVMGGAVDAWDVWDFGWSQENGRRRVEERR